MNVAAMGKPQSFYDRARREAIRRKVEWTLSCDACGRGNRPGSVVIDIDEYDDARCPCGHIFRVHIDYGI